MSRRSEIYLKAMYVAVLLTLALTLLAMIQGNAQVQVEAAPYYAQIFTEGGADR